MRHFILTDLEGVTGIDSFQHTRTHDDQQKAPAMDQLGREVNACIKGIRSVDADADIVVWDGHGSGGLREEDVEGATYCSESSPYFDLPGFDSQFFVGQHAMAGTAFAPLRHTYSSTSVESYRLNGTFVGEFGCRALVAGKQAVPTVFLSGDDKACHEARMFVPEIETVVTKHGKGEEAAEHVDRNVALDRIVEGSARATERIDDIPPLSAFEPPYELVIRYYDPVEDDQTEGEFVDLIDDFTIKISSDSLVDPNDELRRAI